MLLRQRAAFRAADGDEANDRRRLMRENETRRPGAETQWASNSWTGAGAIMRKCRMNRRGAHLRRFGARPLVSVSV